MKAIVFVLDGLKTFIFVFVSDGLEKLLSLFFVRGEEHHLSSPCPGLIYYPQQIGITVIRFVLVSSIYTFLMKAQSIVQ